ncbi:MAG: domain S-box-containing protein [Bacteroidetes bacterium]|nr:domain S-box-containing protein [Bacteroidota bacterium]
MYCMNMTTFTLYWHTYKNYVRKIVLPSDNGDLRDISFWRNEIFCSMMTYIAPVSIIALIPSVYMAFRNGFPVVGVSDLAAFILLIAIMTTRGLTLPQRKFIFICIIYTLSIVLLYYVSTSGAGMLFLLALTVLTAIVYSPAAAYYSALANTLICIVFGILIYMGIHVSIDTDQKVGTWIAVSSNLILLSLACAEGLNLLLKGLDTTIHERLIAEKEIKELNENLERRITDRTAALTEANKALESFSYIAAHDLQSPLRVLSGYSSILKMDHRDELSPDAQRLLDIIIKSSGHMSKLVADLLTFSRASHDIIDHKKINCNDLVQEIVNQVKLTFTSAAEVHIHDLGDAICDAGLMRQVWSNLISNAFKYSSKKEKPVIEIGRKDTRGETIFYVKDNGAGFDMDKAPRLFQVFNRLHAGTDFEGNGIGLALARNIIVRHGGRIWAEAEVDKGATFYFTLPE